MPAFPSPTPIAAPLERRVVGRKEPVGEMSVVLIKKLAKLRVGNRQQAVAASSFAGWDQSSGE